MNDGSPVFVDTNVLLYVFDQEVSKQRRATRWVQALWDSGRGRVSWQVLNEFYDNATRKIGAPAAVVRSMTRSYTEWQPCGFQWKLVQRAWHWADTAQIRYWDGLILASAETLGCRWLLTEDFQHARQYGAVQVVNPFRVEPDSLFRA